MTSYPTREQIQSQRISSYLTHKDVKCETCGKTFNIEFRDELSFKEYVISGMCQECQDDVFGTGDDDDYMD